jgi:hypothetical protein
MVSPEGACAAYFNYGRYSMASERATMTEIDLSDIDIKLEDIR